MAIAMKNQGNFTVAVGIPFTQASLTGFLGGFVVGMGDSVFHFTAMPVQTALLGSAVVTFGAWLHFRGKWQETLNLSLGAPSKKQEDPKMEKKQSTVTFEFRQNNDGFLQVDWLELPPGIDTEQMIRMSDLITNHSHSFSHADLSGPGKIFTRPQFETLRSYYLQRKWAVWNNPNARKQGLSLTVAGKNVTRLLAEKIKNINPPPPPGLRLTKSQ